MTISKENYTLVKKDISKSRLNPQVAKRITFAHQIQQSQVGLTVIPINLQALSTPTEMSANGFVQATQTEINGATIGIAKKNLRLSSSLKGILIPNKHYIVVDNYTINLIGDCASAIELGEIIFGEIDTQIGDLVPASVRSAVKTVSVPIGQRQVNLGLEFQVGTNPNERVGAIQVKVRGGSTFYRNTGNSSTVLDGDYYEMDSGNGYGTNIMLNASPTYAPLDLVVDYGPVTVTNNDSLGTIQSLMGAVKKIANDLAIVIGGSSTDYLTANPSDIERRTFGDSVLSLLSRMTSAEATVYNERTASFSYQVASNVNPPAATAGAYTAFPINTLVDPFGIVTSLVSNQFVLQAGTYTVRCTKTFSVNANITGAVGVSIRLRNMTDSVTIVKDSGNNQSFNAGQSIAYGALTCSIDTVFVLTKATLLEFDYLGTYTGANFLGNTVNDGSNEFYFMANITRIK